MITPTLSANAKYLEKCRAMIKNTEQNPKILLYVLEPKKRVKMSQRKIDLGISIDSKSVDQVTTNQTWLFQSMKYFSNLSYLSKKWPLLVLDNWKVVTNFLLKAVTQVLLFSGVTAFNSLPADFKSMLMPRFGYTFFSWSK